MPDEVVLHLEGTENADASRCVHDLPALVQLRRAGRAGEAGGPAGVRLGLGRRGLRPGGRRHPRGADQPERRPRQQRTPRGSDGPRPARGARRPDPRPAWRPPGRGGVARPGRERGWLHRARRGSGVGDDPRGRREHGPRRAVRCDRPDRLEPPRAPQRPEPAHVGGAAESRCGARRGRGRPCGGPDGTGAVLQLRAGSLGAPAPVASWTPSPRRRTGWR